MPKKNDTWNVMRSQNVQVATALDQKTAKFYSDIQADFLDLYPRMMMWSLIPYTWEDENGVRHTKTSDDVLADLKKSVPADILDDVILIGTTISQKPQTEASSFYGVMCNNYNSTGKAKWTTAKGDFLSKLPVTSDDDLSKIIAKDPSLKQMSVAEWREVEADIANGTSPKQAWEKIASSIGKQVNSAYERVRAAIGPLVRQPNSVTYCSTLAEMLRRQVASAYEKCVQHQKESGELLGNVSVAEAANKPLFAAILELWNRLTAIGNGLSEKTLLRAIKLAADGADPKKCNIQDTVLEITKPEFSCIIKAKRQDVLAAYRGVKTKNRLDRRKPYPSMAQLSKDQKVIFGLTGRAKFTMSALEGKLTVSLDDGAALSCKRSHYFHDLTVEKDADGNQYTISFRHRLKSPKHFAVSDLYVGKVKEIGLRKKNGSFYVTLPFTLSYSTTNNDLAVFFKTAHPDVKKYNLPEKITVAGFDMNMSDPLVAGKAEFTKNGEGPLTALDYGGGHMIEQPSVICPDTKLSAKASEITRNINKIKWCIRAYKTAARTQQPLHEEAVEFLDKIKHKSPSQATRCLIQTWFKEVNTKLRALHNQIRITGYKELSDSLRILEAQDAMKSLTDSYERIHLKPGETLPKKKRFDERRQNFRKFLSRKYASKIVQYAKGCNLIVIEDLSSDLDRDNQNNSLVRLFSPGTLVKAIEDAAHKQGIGVVKGDPAGTSKIDAVTGQVGYRNFMTKKFLYVERNGVLGYVNADKNAVINVISRGMGHSVMPYKVFVRGPAKELKTGEEEREVGKRNKRYFTSLFGSAKPVFVMDKSGEVKATKKTTKSDAVLKNCYLYVNGDQFATQESHHGRQHAIKYRLDQGEIPVEMDLSPYKETGYGGFRALKVLAQT